MTVEDLLANWTLSVATIRDFGIVVLENGWADGSGWGNNYAYGERSGWVGGKLIMRLQ